VSLVAGVVRLQKRRWVPYRTDSARQSSATYWCLPLQFAAVLAYCWQKCCVS